MKQYQIEVYWNMGDLFFTTSYDSYEILKPMIEFYQDQGFHVEAYHNGAFIL
jgi:hypothetical protein